jgi:hypothetical protein
MNKKKGRIKHSSKPKTWKVEKQTYSPLLRHKNNIQEKRREEIIKRLSEVTGWREGWFSDKSDAVILKLAQKHL